MAKFRFGKNGYVGFIDGTGTITLTANMNKLSVKRQIDTIDVTTGNETAKTRITGIKDYPVSFKGLHNGTASGLGTSDLARLAEGKEGTLVWGPLGNTSGNPKGGVAVIVKNQDTDMPYDDKVEVSLEFDSNGTLAFDPNIDTW